MEILGVGIDTADIRRFEDKEDLALRVLSPQEFEEYQGRADKAQFLASRFSVKESYVKASGDRKTDFREIEVRKEKDVPVLFVKGRRVPSFLSISHDSEAVSILILTKEEEK